MPKTDNELLDRANFYGYTLGRMDRAIELYLKYARLFPQDASLYIYLFHAYIFQKDYPNAWKTFEKRFDFYKEGQDAAEMAQFALKCLKMPRRWDGKTSLSGKTVLVWGEEGIGDIIHFLRFLPSIKALGATVLLATRYETLASLLSKQPYIDRLYVAKNEPLTTDYDYILPIMSIPHLTECYDFPPPPYLQVDGKTDVPTSAAKKVGLCWAGAASFFKDAARSHRLNEFQGLATPEIALVSLQKERRLDEWGESIHLIQLPIETMEDTAQIINDLDAVVSVDSGVVHLAGAMNKPCFLLKADYPEWRWGLNEVTTPWYPNTRICNSVAEITRRVKSI